MQARSLGATHRGRAPGDSLSDTESAAWRGLLRVHAALARELDNELCREHDLPLSSYEVLASLERAPGGRMRMRDLADSVALSRSGLTRLVDRLARERLLERAGCRADGRGAFAVITEAGRGRLRRARPDHLEAVRRHFLGHFGERELRTLADLWERVLPGAAKNT
jgi:DNA-binding MarR family transcriptional regulator